MIKIISTIVILLLVQSIFFIEKSSAQWEPDFRLTNATGSSLLKSNWSVAANGNFVYAVWFDYRDGNPEIYFKRSTNNGTNWETDTRLTNDPEWSQSPTIAVSNNMVHVSWIDWRNGNAEIYYKRSSDGGINWGNDIRLTNSTGSSVYSSIAISGSNVSVVWTDQRDGNSEIYYKRSTDNGINWESDFRLTNNTFISDYSCLAHTGTIVHVAWDDSRDANKEIYYKRSTDNGATWGTDTRLTNTTAISLHPSIAVSGNLVHVVWEESNKINYKLSTDGGVSWGPDVQIVNFSNNSTTPSVATSGSLVHAVWVDELIGGYRDIWYKRSTNNGASWGTDTRLTDDPAESLSPSIAISGTVVNVVWQDSRDGNAEIYFKRDPTGNTVGILEISTEIPSSYSLSQNYPNPFNPTTKIKFQVPSQKFIKLVVFDILGKEVETLVNEQLQPGTYEATFDAGNLNSGIYFYRLETEGFSETKKMILIK